MFKKTGIAVSATTLILLLSACSTNTPTGTPSDVTENTKPETVNVEPSSRVEDTPQAAAVAFLQEANKGAGEGFQQACAVLSPAAVQDVSDAGTKVCADALYGTLSWRDFTSPDGEENSTVGIAHGLTQDEKTWAWVAENVLVDEEDPLSVRVPVPDDGETPEWKADPNASYGGGYWNHVANFDMVLEEVEGGYQVGMLLAQE